MRLGLVGDLITHASGKGELPAIGQFRVELAFKAEQNVAFRAPMVGEVARRVFQDTDPNITKLTGAPKCFARGAGMLDGFDGAPIRGAEGDISNFHDLLEKFLAADVTHLDLGAGFTRGEQAGAFVAVAIFAATPDASDIRGKLRVIGPSA